MPPTATFQCAVCLEDVQGSGVRVSRSSMCDDCIQSSIIPMFEDAVKYEHHYPPKFGQHALHPETFAKYFPDFKDFMVRWHKKLREYETPYKQRIYCASTSCELFVWTKGVYGRMVCECGTFTHVCCGALAVAGQPLHTCPLATTREGDATATHFQDLKRGKDYQLCPTCETPVELRDGCNQIICEKHSCNTSFCFLCGAKAGSNSGHWNIGNPCPRWNQPENGRFDFPPFQGQEFQAALARLERAQQIAAAAEGFGQVPGFGALPPVGADAQPQGAQDAVPSADPLFDAIGEAEVDRRVEEVILMFDDVPDLGDLTGMTDNEQFMTEVGMSAELESSSLGILMRRHRDQLQAMINDILAGIGADTPREQVQGRIELLDLIEILHDNLDLYVYRKRLLVHLEEFEERHDHLEAAHHTTDHFNPHAIYAAFPEFYEILSLYTTIAEIRLLATVEAVEGTASEEEATRVGIDVRLRGTQARRDARTVRAGMQ